MVVSKKYSCKLQDVKSVFGFWFMVNSKEKYFISVVCCKVEGARCKVRNKIKKESADQKE
jgi:hypothetical protein